MALDPRLLAVSRAHRTRARCSTSATRTGCTTRDCIAEYLVRDGIPVMLIDEAVAVDDTEHAAIMARVSSEGLAPTFAVVTGLGTEWEAPWDTLTP